MVDYKISGYPHSLNVLKLNFNEKCYDSSHCNSIIIKDIKVIHKDFISLFTILKTNLNLS